LYPEAEENIVKITDVLGETEFGHDMYKCIWYWYEIQARIKNIGSMYPHLPFYKLQTEDLNNIDVLLDMFEKLNIPVNRSKLTSLTGTRANTKSDQKSRDIATDDCNTMHEKLLARMEHRYGKDFWI
jgi:hypothetical protein